MSGHCVAPPVKVAMVMADQPIGSAIMIIDQGLVKNYETCQNAELRDNRVDYYIKFLLYKVWTASLGESMPEL